MQKFVVTIAGDSGDGIQLLGNTFAENVALEHLDLNTLPDFPAEIRAPAGTVNGVSGFQIQYGSDRINTAGNKSDVFVAFNAAALKKYFNILKPTGILLYDPSGFDTKNCKLANFDLSELEAIPNKKIEIPFSKLTREALADVLMEDKERDKNKNIFAIGILSFALDSSIDKSLALLDAKFKNEALERMKIVLQKGFHYAETIEFSLDKIDAKAQFSHRHYKNITGNKAISLAILAAPATFGRNVFYGGYPITPASDILHELAKFSLKEIIVKQAEDEIAAVSMALGAAFGGSIGVTVSSGPGIDLKQEAIGLAVMAEIPLLIVDVQRAGPSTGMPTKVEQSDLNSVLKGRHGDCPVPVVAIKSPSTAYQTTLDAIEAMIKFQTPVFLMSDALIANSSELWEIPVQTKLDKKRDTELFPYQRNETSYTRPWVDVGQENTKYIVGGLEKDAQNGTISYDGDNHQLMTDIRFKKMESLAAFILQCKLEDGSSDNGTLVLSWGSTYGAVREATLLACKKQVSIAHLHLEWIYPLPKNFDTIIANYSSIIVPELNNGQLADYISTVYKKPIHKINKLKAQPFFEEELSEQILSIVENSK